jgi:thiosulfate/3-mercaptopyruvate sulfurtransferase
MKPLLHTLFALAALGFCMATWAAQPLLTPSELKGINHASDVRVIDIRSAKDYAAGHIPGAVSAPYPEWRGPADNPGQLPAQDKLAALVRNLGLAAHTHAIVLSSGKNATDFGGSARVYWTLKYLGLTRLSILNGGFQAWQDAGLPQSRDVPEITPTNYQVHLDKSLIAKTGAVAAQVDNPQTRLVDARPHKYYIGEVKAPTVQIAGTIKGAVNLEESQWFKPGTGLFVAPDKAKQIASRALTQPAEETVSFCNTGHWAATDWFALSEIAGLENVRLYPESLTAWTQDADLPMQNKSSRGEQILRKIKSVFN